MRTDSVIQIHEALFHKKSLFPYEKVLHNPYSPFIAPITVLLAEHKLNIDVSKEKEISFFKTKN